MSHTRRIVLAASLAAIGWFFLTAGDAGEPEPQPYTPMTVAPAVEYVP